MVHWQKQIIVIAGLLLALPGFPLIFSFLCVTTLLIVEGDSEAVGVGLTTFTLAMVTAGAGVAIFWHGLAALQGKNSGQVNLPPVWALIGIFGLLVVVGLFISESSAAGLLFPPILVAAAALPPLWAVSWFRGRSLDELTWRRGLVIFAGGATVSVVIAVVLEILFPLVVLTLVFNLANIAVDRVETLFEALAGRDVASAITNPGFIYIFVQVAIIAPLAEELAKPLITLPLIGRLSRRGAFLLGAVAGAGFAAIENVMYAGFGFYFWAGILLVRALGGAIHPLGAGLVALGWQDILRGEAQAWLKWSARFAIAVGMHALWNGGSLLVITLAGAQFFGELPPEIDLLGLSAAGTTLALLIVLGLAAMWVGRSIAQRSQPSKISLEEWADAELIPSDRAVAVWALACLVAIVPMGITGLQILMR